MGNVYQARFKKKWDSSPIEKIHLKFCKRYLEVNNKASNIASRAELGRLPLLIPINKKIMKYFVYLNNKDNDSIVKQSFLISKNLHSMNNSRNYSNFINMFEQYNLTSLETESLENDKIRRYTTEIREKYLSFWQQSLENSKKLEFNNTFKGNLHSLRKYRQKCSSSLQK